MPRARPLTTTSPAAASSRPSSRATCEPYDERPGRRRSPTPAPAEQLDCARPAQEEPRRRVMELSQRRRIRGLAASEEPQPAGRERSPEAGLVEGAPEALEASLARLLDHMAAGLRREGGQDEVAHGVPSSVGERYESASATWAVPTSSAPASSAIVLATRATRARPRADSGSRSTARVRSSFASRDRRVARRDRARAPMSPSGNRLGRFAPQRRRARAPGAAAP